MEPISRIRGVVDKLDIANIRKNIRENIKLSREEGHDDDEGYYYDRAVDHILDNVIIYIGEEIKDYSGNTAKYNFIRNSIEAVHTVITYKIPDSNDRYYQLAISYVMSEFESKLYDTFGSISREYALSSNPNPAKLVFNMPKEQIAALLYILNEAGFLRESPEAVIAFAEKYFHFPNQKRKGELQPCYGLRGKYRDVRNSDVNGYDNAALDKVKSALEQALKKLQPSSKTIR